jgi:hypothetical protein
MRRPHRAFHPEAVPLRIGLLRVPRLLADVVRSAFATGEADFEELDGAGEAAAPDRAGGAGHDAVIAGVEDAWERDVIELKREHPGVVVLGVRSDGRRTWLYELVPHPRPLGELGPVELRATLLAAVHAAAS